jgi:hypothetical protein
MDKACPEFERFQKRFAIGATNSERQAWAAHRAQCSECCEQWDAEQALRGLFSASSCPELSEHFHESLRHRLRTETQRRPKVRFALMQAYWLVAAVASAIILCSLPWPESIAAEVWWIGVVLLVICFVAPVLILGRQLNLGLCDLIVRTMEPAAGRPVTDHNGGGER